MRWTPEQQAAIEARNHTVLVSAAAGSGKTAVLVERIVSLLREGHRLQRMLIITFTRAAAGEMRQRLNQRLRDMVEEAPDIARLALDDLEITEISTIHAFCQRLLKMEFQLVGLDPLARAATREECLPLWEDAYRAALNSLYEGDSQDFHTLSQCFTQAELREMTDALYEFAMAMPDPFAWMREAAAVEADSLAEHPWALALRDKAALNLQGLDAQLDVLDRLMGHGAAVEKIVMALTPELEALRQVTHTAARDGEAALALLQGVTFARMPVVKGLTEEETAWKQELTASRDALKERVSELRLSCLFDEARNLRDLPRVAACLRGLVQVAEETHRRFAEAKLERNLFDFHDMEHMALRILRDEHHLPVLQGLYDHIFVDECQDISRAQDAIIQLIHGPDSCLFMVGDVKQSIYRFRQADPTLFLRRMRTYSRDPEAAERAIFLQKNFRSTPAVLEAVNSVFERAMTARVTELDYLPEDRLIPGRSPSAQDAPVELRVVRTEEKLRAADRLAAEAGIIARRIHQLVGKDLPGGEGARPCRYRDICVLMASVAHTGERMAKLLRQEGIPVFLDGNEAYYELPEIIRARALLEVIDNPLQDLHLLSALKAPMFEFTDSELAGIRVCLPGKRPFYEAFERCCEEQTPLGERCRAVRDTLARWRLELTGSHMPDFMWMLLRDSGWYARCGAYPDGESRQANLRTLIYKADEYERRGGEDLRGFLDQLERERQSGDASAAKALGEQEDLVRIMTMHKSKGLEFPVVFLARTSQAMEKPVTGMLQAHRELGLCVPWIDREEALKRHTIGREAIGFRRALDERAERCRLLYVAMTRARELLVLTGCEDEAHPEVWTLPPTPWRVAEAGCMLDWVMQAAMDEEQRGLSHFQLVWEPFDPIDERRVTRPLVDVRQVVAQALAGDAPALAPVWPEEKGYRAKKFSVTTMISHQQLLREEPLSEEEETPATKRLPAEVLLALERDLPDRPEFMMEKRSVSGAERGTLIHRFLSVAPLEALRDQPLEALRSLCRDALADMVRRQVFTPEEAALIPTDSCARFYDTDLARRMLRSPDARREWGFTYRLDRRRKLYLQGVIDCVFLEDGGWILCDYKTDRVNTPQELIDRHRDQLSWYALALEQISRIPVRELWLYSIHLNQPIPLERNTDLDAPEATPLGTPEATPSGAPPELEN